MATDDKRRIEKLEDELKLKTERITELKDEIDEQRDLIRRFEERDEETDHLIERWIEAFNMEQNENGAWGWGAFVTERLGYQIELEDLRKEFNALVIKHNALAKKWNYKLLGGQPVGRPLNASEAQIAQALKLRNAGTSLRNIAEEMNLGLNTVRTIIDKKHNTGRVRRRFEMLRRKGFETNGYEMEENEIERTAEERQKAIKFKRQKRTIEALPKQVQHALEEGQALRKEAKGLGGVKRIAS